MEKLISGILGKALVCLTVYGLLPGRHMNRFLGLMNTDTNHSVLRIPITLALLFGATTNVKVTRSILTGVGALYVGIAAAGLLDKKVKGALPSGLTNFDIVYHGVVGLATVWLGKRPGRMMKP